MKKSWALSVVVLLLFICSMGLSYSFAGPNAPEGYRNVKLGMTKTQILEILKKNPGTDSFEEIGDEIGEIIRNDNLFRFAAYKFDSNDALVEIDLQMREILGRDKVLEIFNAQYGLDISPSKKFVGTNRAIEVQDNRLVIKSALDRPKRSARSGE